MDFRYFDSSEPLPNIVFVDTSFIFDLMRYPEDIHNRELAEGREFYEKLCDNGTILWITPLVVQESIWKLIRKEIFLVRDSSGNSSLNLAELKRNNLRIYKRGYNNGRVKVSIFLSFIKAAKFTINYASPFKNFNTKNRSELIVRYSAEIIKNYYLESADAFHIATAKCNEVYWIVSNDKAFQSIPDIGVYSNN